MIDLKFEIGGRRVDPRNIGDALQAAVLESIAEQIHAKVRGICHSQTGEAPVVVVRGDDLEHLSIEVSGSISLECGGLRKMVCRVAVPSARRAAAPAN